MTTRCQEHVQSLKISHGKIIDQMEHNKYCKSTYTQVNLYVNQCPYIFMNYAYFIELLHSMDVLKKASEP